jgi:hypothetical protein
MTCVEKIIILQKQIRTAFIAVFLSVLSLASMHCMLFSTLAVQNAMWKSIIICVPYPVRGGSRTEMLRVSEPELVRTLRIKARLESKRRLLHFPPLPSPATPSWTVTSSCSRPDSFSATFGE